MDTAGQHSLLLGGILPAVPVLMLICANTPLSHRHRGSGNSSRDSGKAYGPQAQIFLQGVCPTFKALRILFFFFNYLSAGKDKHQGGSGSSEAPGEQSPQQGLGHGAVAFQHGGTPGPTAEHSESTTMATSRLSIQS